MIKIIGVLGYSGSGKTYFISNAIRLLKQKLNFKSAVIKDIHEHQIDKKGKDTYIYGEAGANYSITLNVYGETTIFIKKEIHFKELIKWLEKGPFKIDILFIEGFKSQTNPSVLCVKNFKDIKELMTENVKALSGLFFKENITEIDDIKLPIINIIKDFEKFINIFKIK
ncbi:MAG: molybdopterin-guanine dinucleotide biosynthesis protein B [Promethearchaeota archaeon]